MTSTFFQGRLCFGPLLTENAQTAIVVEYLNTVCLVPDGCWFDIAAEPDKRRLIVNGPDMAANLFRGVARCNARLHMLGCFRRHESFKLPDVKLRDCCTLSLQNTRAPFCHLG